MHRKFLLALAAFALALVVAEIGAWVWLTRFAGEESFRRYAGLAQLERRLEARSERKPYSPHRYLGYYPTPGFERGPNRHNAAGFRGDEIPQPKPDGEFRIVCLGGSTTYGASLLDFREAYPQLLERELRQAGHESVRVVNAGSSGWSSFESLINLEFRVLDLDPDMIVVYHGINDIHPRLVWPPESYRGDNSGKRAANEARLRPPSRVESSTLLRYLLVRSGRIRPHATLRRTVDSVAETYYGDDFERQQLDGTYPAGIFTEIPAERMLRANPPIYFKRNLEHIVVLARQHGIVPVLATFAYSPEFDDAPHVSTKEYIAAYRETNDIVRGVTRETDAPLIDFAERFDAESRYFVDGIHMTAEGSAMQAWVFARRLLELELIP